MLESWAKHGKYSWCVVVSVTMRVCKAGVCICKWVRYVSASSSTLLHNYTSYRATGQNTLVLGACCRALWLPIRTYANKHRTTLKRLHPTDPPTRTEATSGRVRKARADRARDGMGNMNGYCASPSHTNRRTDFVVAKASEIGNNGGCRRLQKLIVADTL